MKKLFKVLVVGGLIASAIGIINANLSSEVVRPVTVVPSVAPTAPGETKPFAGPTGVAEGPSTPPVVTAPPPYVTAAATAVDILSSAQFLPLVEMYPFVENLAVKDQWPTLKSTFASSGPLMAQIWGYESSAEANARATYFVQTERYRVTNVQATEAIVTLFTVSHWVTAANQEYRVPSLSSVRLSLVDNVWLYVQSSPLPASQQPIPADRLSYAETVQRFQPYLEGFEFYVNED